MKTIFYLLILTLGLFLSEVLHAQENKNDLKPGDWFECEMEFENRMPVFRNHYFNQNHSTNEHNLISIRFTLDKSDSSNVDRWQYKVLRYRSLWLQTSKNKFLEAPNIYCNDTWYPEYFIERYDSIRNSLSGILSVGETGIVKHEFNYNTKDYFGQKAVLPCKRNNYFFSSTFSTSNNDIAQNVEKVGGLIFQPQSFKEQDKTRMKWQWVDNVKQLSDKETSFTLHENSSNPDHQKQTYTAYLLENGLTYAFIDKHQQKVLAITNASFPLPNKAVLYVTDQRKNKEKEENQFSDLIWITPNNPSQVIHETGDPQFMKLTSIHETKTFTLKCGVAFELHTGTGQKANLFIEPGDTISIVLRDDATKPLEIIGNDNSLWWQNINYNIDQQNILQAPITEEFKSYLVLAKEIRKRINLKKPTDINAFKNSILDFFYLKSYHYDTYIGANFKWFAINYNNWREHLITESGSPYRNGFRYNYNNAIAHYTDFLLYFELHDILTGQYSYYQMGKDQHKFTEFIDQCGDTLLQKDLRNKLLGRKSIQPGSNLPFKSLLTENNKEVNIMPAKGKYGLLFLYSIADKAKEFRQLTDSLPDYIQNVSYGLIRDTRKHSKNKLPFLTLAEGENMELYGHPLMNSLLDDILVTVLNSVIVLYDDKGTVLYSDTFEKQYGESNYLESYRNKITEAIEKSKITSKNDLSQLLMIIGISIVITIFLIFMFYRHRIRKIKKRSAQEKMIQELKLKSVQSQLNPHFMFNALNSIQLLVNSNNVNQANKYLIGFSNLLRGVLGNADKRLVPLSDELDLINRYCELEQLRMDFTYKQVVNTNTLPDLIEVPYMLLQPIVENAIKHGIGKNEGKGLLRVEVLEKNSYLYIKVMDNGPGFNGMSFDQLFEKGKGLKLTMEKLESIYKGDAELTISNNETSTGGIVHIKLKIG